MSQPPLLLITGAGGFVGGHLTVALRGTHRLRCLVREGEEVPGGDGVEVVTGDLGDRDGLAALLDGVDCAYYLVHSMDTSSDDDFAARDRALATNMAEAASGAGLRRLVYMGGIDPEGADSEHLDSRHEVEEILGGFGGEFVAVRAAMIIGHGSASFDTLAQIVDRLPLLALPTWRDRLCQPIGIEDVVAALAAAPDVAPGRYDVAGTDRLTFQAMTEEIARLLGKTPRSIKLPFTNSTVEGAAAAVVTDQGREILGPLMAGLDADLIVEDNALQTVFGVEPTGFEDAARTALAAGATG